MKRIIKALKTIDYKLWLAILSQMVFPTVYKTVRIFLLGDMPSDWGFNIASQLAWVDLFYEVIQEALILPLFFILGKSIGNKDELEDKVRSGLIITAFIYFIVSVFISVFARQLVIFMAQKEALVDATVSYIRLETIAAFFSTLVRFVMLVLIILKKPKHMYAVLSIQMVLSVVLDVFLVSNLSVSANIGVNGIAITNIIVNVLMLGAVILLLQKENIRLFKRKKLDFKWMKEWFHVGKYSGIESLLRNLAFMIMIIRMVNVVSEQGNYWVANNFIWNWLLLPGLALADLVKKEVGEKEDNIAEKTFGYLLLTAIFASAWLLSIPLWKPFLRYVMNVESFDIVYKIVLIQTGFYITFLFNSCVLDSTFYGLGKTNYMLIQSICIDAFYYGVMFILYKTGIFIPSLMSISLMFGGGMLLDFIPTLILYIRLLKQKNLIIDFRFNRTKV